jgi:hypothetical protein
LVSLANLVDAEELLSLIGALAVGWPLRHDRVLLRSEDAQLASTSLQNRHGLLRIVAAEREKKGELATGVEQSLRQRDPRVPEWVVAAL